MLIRRLFFLLALVAFAFCLVLLLNLDVPNPTQRRYSSENPLRTGGNALIGADGERILAKDLGLPNNNTSGTTQCVCSADAAALVPARCNSCFAYGTITSSAERYRIPDFVTDQFIADSKNVTALGEYAQLRDFTLAALQLNIPLWVYVRVDTRVDQRSYDLVRSTGGDIVKYFAYPGYVDPTEQAARQGAAVSFGVIVLLLAGEVWILRRGKPNITVPSSRPARPPKQATNPIAEIDKLRGKARQRVDEADSNAYYE